MNSSSGSSPAAMASIITTASASPAVKVQPFRRRKSSRATKAVRLLPSMKGWFRAMPSA